MQNQGCRPNRSEAQRSKSPKAWEFVGIVVTELGSNSAKKSHSSNTEGTATKKQAEQQRATKRQSRTKEPRA